MSDGSQTPRQRLDAIEKSLRDAHQAGENLTGVIRWYWEELAPWLETRRVHVTEIARRAQVNRNSLMKSIQRVRQERRQSADASARHPGNPGRRSRQATAGNNPATATTAGGPRPRRRPPEASAPSTPRPTPDAEGWIPLENGSHYRRKPDMPNLFEVWKPGKQKPDMTTRHPDPNQR